MKLERKLQMRLDGLESGARLPSLRKLAEELDTNIPTLERTLSRLAATGQIFIKPRSGVYKALPIRRKLEILVFNRQIVEGSFSFHTYFFQTVAAHLLCSERQVRIHIREEEFPPEQLRGIANPADSIVLTYRIGAEQAAVWEALEQWQVPTVHIIPNLMCDIGLSIRLNDEETIRQQLKFLLERGYRRIGYLYSGSTTRYTRVREERLNAFCRLAVQFGVEMTPDYLVELSDPETDVEHAVAGFRRSSRPPEAILLEDRHAPLFYRAMRKHGMEPGREIAVLGTNDMPWAEMLSPALSSIRISPESLKLRLDEAIALLEARKPALSTELEQQIIARDTTG